jgi:hypothetical protein
MSQQKIREGYVNTTRVALSSFLFPPIVPHCHHHSCLDALESGHAPYQFGEDGLGLNIDSS